MADTNDPQPAYRITYLLAATKVAQEWAPDSLSKSKAYQILIHRRNGTQAHKGDQGGARLHQSLFGRPKSVDTDRGSSGSHN